MLELQAQTAKQRARRVLHGWHERPKQRARLRGSPVVIRQVLHQRCLFATVLVARVATVLFVAASNAVRVESMREGWVHSTRRHLCQQRIRATACTAWHLHLVDRACRNSSDAMFFAACAFSPVVLSLLELLVLLSLLELLVLDLIHALVPLRHSKRWKSSEENTLRSLLRCEVWSAPLLVPREIGHTAHRFAPSAHFLAFRGHHFSQ